MYRATTPKHTFTLPFSTANIDKLYLTYKQDRHTLELRENDVDFDGNKIIVTLTQEQTKGFCANDVIRIQARCKMVTGEVIASNIISTRALNVLNDEVIS